MIPAFTHPQMLRFFFQRHLLHRHLTQQIDDHPPMPSLPENICHLLPYPLDGHDEFTTLPEKMIKPTKNLRVFHNGLVVKMRNYQSQHWKNSVKSFRQKSNVMFLKLGETKLKTYFPNRDVRQRNDMILVFFGEVVLQKMVGCGTKVYGNLCFGFLKRDDWQVVSCIVKHKLHKT